MRLGDADIRPFIEVHNEILREFFEEIKKREEQHRMTITDIETPEVAVRNAPEGTILRLIEEDSIGAGFGALAFKGAKTWANDVYVDIRWLTGHLSEHGVQSDGGYYPHCFEVFEFQIGDRVRVKNLGYEAGYEGVIVAVPATNGDDCLVEIDTPRPYKLSYKFRNLAKVDQPTPSDEALRALREKLSLIEDEDDDDYEEPLADWELELLGPAPLAKGDIAVIDFPENSGFDKAFRDAWQGLRFPVLKAFPSGNNFDLADAVFDKRPDGFDSDFLWDGGKVRAFDPIRDFQVGDLVEAPRYGRGPFTPAKGVVTATEGDFLGDIEVNWTEGNDALVAAGPLGVTVETLTLVGTTEIREVRNVVPQPILIDFDFEAGQEIGSSDVLDDLPVGTTVVINGDTASPAVKLHTGKFGRVNRYAPVVDTALGKRMVGYDETAVVTKAADSDDQSLMIAYVPA